MTLLEVDDLSVDLATPDGLVRVVDGLSFQLGQGGALGLVGESGSGKTLAMRALLDLLPPGALRAGRATFRGENLCALPARRMREIRGRHIALIPQDPAGALNPYRRIGAQMIEGPVVHLGLARAAATRRAESWLERVGMDSGGDWLRRYPHELSGGQRQRVTFAMALACEPDVLVADEPTTALDVTVQAQVLALLAAARDEHGTALVLIAHDLSLVAGLCDEVLVMYAGRAMEQGPASALFAAPAHPYTRALLASIPDPRKPGRLQSIAGQSPAPQEVPPACPFEPRCTARMPVCSRERPVRRALGAGHWRACHLDAER